MSFRTPRPLRDRSSSRRAIRRSSTLQSACHKVAGRLIEALESRQLLSVVTPSHVVIVFEEDRFANAIGDTTNMPYVNQLASSGLVYSNAHGLNTTAQEGEMNYLALYSGSTQGVTDNGFHGPYAGGNLAQSLNNSGQSFVGFAEAMPHDGDTTDQLAADPTNAAYDDLYTRSYNPMAQFSNVGTGFTNAQVNKTFASFPTTTTGYAALPTVSFVIPDTLHNAHGSNDTNPFATDPSAYNLLRQNADNFLKNKIDGYLQWAKQNNSLLIVVSDEGDRAHGFTSLATNNITLIVNGSTNLFVPGTNTTSANVYNVLRTVEDMYGLVPLGTTSSISGLDTNAAGQLTGPTVAKSATTTAVASDTNPAAAGQTVTFTATVSDSVAGTPTGTVTFKDGTTTLGSGTLNASGQATFSTSVLSATPHSITAVYGGDANFSGSTSPALSQLVNAPAAVGTTTSLASSLGTSTYGQGVTFTATVSPASGTGTPSGTVQFTVDGSNVGSPVTLSGGAATSASINNLSAGAHTVAAVYSGDSSFSASTASGITQTVNQATTAAALVSSSNPSTFGQSVTFTATLSASGAIKPSGTVTFADGGSTLGTGTLNASGVATFTTSSLSAASHSITASYAGNSNFVGSTSGAVTQTVNPATSGVINDNFANATVISGSSITVTGSNVGATKEAGEPNHGGNSGGKSIWYSWTAPTSGAATIDTHGSTFDTLLGVYTGTSVSALTTIASNDDDPAGGTTTSKVKFNAVAGTVYMIAVDGYGGQSGSVTLNVSLGTVVVPAAPTGVSASDGTFSDGVHVTWAAPTGATAYEVWRNTTNSSSSATKISATDVTTTTYTDTTATAGKTYFYWVKAKNSAGTSGFSASDSGFRSATTLTNDNFANATVISGSTLTVTGSNVGATKEPGEPNHAGNSGGKSIWYAWTAPTSGTVTLDTHGSTFDTLLGVYTGSSVSTLTTIASNDDDPAGGTTTSKLTFRALAGTTYYFAVDGYGGQSGSVTLNLSLV